MKQKIKLIAMTPRYLPSLILVSVLILLAYSNMTDIFETIEHHLKLSQEIHQQIINFQERQFFIVLMIFIILGIEIMLMLFGIKKDINYYKKAISKSSDIISKNVIYSKTNTQGIIIDVSEAFCQISGYSKKELLGKPHNIIRHPHSHHQLFRTMWHTIKKGKIWEGEIKNLKKDGTFYWVKTTISPEYDKKGKIVSYLAIREDISAKKEVEAFSSTLEERIQEEIAKNRIKDQQLLEQSRLAQMGEMLNMIAHQWRQPLSAISATTSALIMKNARGNYESDFFDNRLHKITQYTQHLSTTIDDFRNFFKDNKDKTETTFEEILHDVLNIIQGSFDHYQIHIQTQLDYNEKMNIYTNEFKQVLLNLFKNAEDALIENKISHPKIYLKTYIEDKNIILSVEDNAGGIDETIIDKVFDPYYSTKQSKDGSGLGLYMSRTIIEEHCKGTLRVRNTQKGAIFTIKVNKSIGFVIPQES